jgi:uncharacterized repeat protein (TIGR01451 family)
MTMSRLLSSTTRIALLAGIVLTMSGFADGVSAQVSLAATTAQVFKLDPNRNGFGEDLPSLGKLTAANDRTFSEDRSLAVGETETVSAPARPSVALLNSVMPSGTQPTGTDLVFTIAFTNSGGQPAQVFMVVDPIPVETDFKLDSPTAVLGTTGMTVIVEYSNDEKATWTYTPISGGGGASEGYDRSVSHVRWRFSGSLSQSFPDNGGSVAVTARIR